MSAQPLIPARIYVSALALVLSLAMSACTSHKSHKLDPIVISSDLSDESEPIIKSTYDKYSDPSYLILLAEHLGRQGHLRDSLDLYLDVADKVEDSKVIKRGLEVALFISDHEAALQLSRKWQMIEPDSFDARLAHLSNQVLLDLTAEASTQLAQLLTDFTFNSERYANLRDRLFGFANIDIKEIAQIVNGAASTVSKNAWWNLLRAEIAIDSDRLDKAMESVNLSLALNPDNEITYHIRARIHFLAQDAEAGLSFIADTLAKKPDFFSLYLMEARWRVSSLEDKSEAEKASNTKRAIERVQYIRDHKDKLGYFHRNLYAQATHLLAFIYTVEKNHDGRKSVLMELREFGAYEEFAYLSLAQLAMEEKDFHLAEDYLQSINAREYLLMALRMYVEVKVALKKWEEALDSIEYYRLRGQNDETALNAILMEGDVYTRLHNYQRAFDLYTAGLNRFKQSHSLLLARSVAAHFLGQVDVIERDMQIILSESPENVSALNSLGYSLASMTTRYEEATRLLKRALEIDPDNFAVQDSYGWLLFKQGRYDKARVYLERAWAGFPDPEIGSHLVELYWSIGLKNKASEFLEKAELEFPESRFLDEVRARLGL